MYLADGLENQTSIDACHLRGKSSATKIISIKMRAAVNASNRIHPPLLAFVKKSET